MLRKHIWAEQPEVLWMKDNKMIRHIGTFEGMARRCIVGLGSNEYAH